MTEVGRVTDGQGNVVIVGTDGERVTLQTHGTVDLTADLTKLFAWLWVFACRQAEGPGGAP
jgi:hypothetical protein